MSNDQKELNTILQLTHELFQIQDLDLLLERVLSELRGLVNAEAGSIYLVEGDKLAFRYAQNDALQKDVAFDQESIYTSFVILINNNSIVGYVANTGFNLRIDDVYKISDGCQYKFDKSFDELTHYKTRSILAVPIRTARGKILGVIQLINAKNGGNVSGTFSADNEVIAQYFANHAALAIERAQLIRIMVMRMIAMTALRDPKETGAHANRVAAYAGEIYDEWARAKKISTKEIEHNQDMLKIAALLHDVGKIAIPDTILKKPGKLSDDERKIIQEHTWRGANLFIELSSDFDDVASCVSLNHHEKWDGSGYPGYINHVDGSVLPGYEKDGGGARGKRGNEIPIFGQIVAIADVYDALSSRRCYKDAFEEAKTLEIIKAESGRHFNPEVVDAFFGRIDALRAIAMKYPDDPMAPGCALPEE